MAHLTGDELFVPKNPKPKTAKHIGKPLRTVAMDSDYCLWMEALPNVTFSPPSSCNYMLTQYIWANPPLWRGRHSAVTRGTKPVALLVLDTETTTAFNNACNGNGLPKEGPNVFAANEEIARVFHLLEIAWKVVDPLTYNVLEKWESLCTPTGAFEHVYNQSLYTEACQNGRPLAECMQTLMETLRRLRTTYEVYIVCHNVAFDRKVLAYSLAVSRMYEAYYELLATPWLCTMTSTHALDTQRFYDTWARQVYPQAYASMPWLHPPPKLERLYYFCTGKDVIQTHRAMSDVDMVIECIPHLVARGWFKVPEQVVPTPNGLTPALEKSIKVLLKKKQTKSSGPSRASKHTSVSTRTYFLRSAGPAPAICL
jgi:hypothetical protein